MQEIRSEGLQVILRVLGERQPTWPWAAAEDLASLERRLERGGPPGLALRLAVRFRIVIYCKQFGSRQRRKTFRCLHGLIRFGTWRRFVRRNDW